MNKKEIRRQYKETLQPMGMYQIKNLFDGKIFIGSSKNLHGKLNGSRFQLRLGSHMNRALQEHFAKLGEEKFSFEIVDFLKSKDEPRYDYSDELAVLEDWWLEKLGPYHDKGYNKREKVS
ncbi:MAG TPA: GIY-YIG nuclease family protein [Candidatus Kryptonia bacterium]